MRTEYSIKSMEELVLKVSKELEELKKLNSESDSVIKAIVIREKLLKELRFMLNKSKDRNETR